MAKRPMIAEPQQTLNMAGEPVSQGELVPAGGGGGGTRVAMASQGWIMTAQPVAIERDMAKIRRKISEYAKLYGDSYYYSWPVTNRITGKKETISGPSVKLTNDIARLWGNSLSGVARVEEEGEYWIFHAFFVDLETGSNYIRPYRQRRNQSLGMPAKEKDRETDIIFQIGTSKAIRNAVVNALSAEVDFALEEAKKTLTAWVEKNWEKANKFVNDAMAQFNVDLVRVESIIGRERKAWTYMDVAIVCASFRQIAQGYEDPNEIFPPATVAQARAAASEAEKKEAEAAAVKKAEDKKKEAEGKQAPAKEEAKPKPEPEKKKAAAPAKEPEKKPEPEPEPEAEAGEEAGEPEAEGGEQGEGAEDLSSFKFD